MSSSLTPQSTTAHINNLSALHAALKTHVELLFPHSKGMGSPIKVFTRAEQLILRADLTQLGQRKCQLEMRDMDLVITYRNDARLFPLANFVADSIFRGNQLELAFAERTEGDRWLRVRHVSGIASDDIWHAATRLLCTVDKASRAIFVTRVLNAITKLSRDVPEQSLAAASTASFDWDVLVRVLGNPEAMGELRREDPFAPARLRGLEAKKQLLEAEGGTMSGQQVARLLRITRQAVDKRRRARQLLGLTHGRRGYAYPSWQFSGSGTVEGLEDVLKAMEHHDPWMQATFLLNSNARLGGRTPLALLREGQLGDVMEAAAAFGEHGAD